MSGTCYVIPTRAGVVSYPSCHESDRSPKLDILCGGKTRSIVKTQAAQWWDPRTWLAFAFWELHSIFKGYSREGMAAWNATGIMIVVEILGLGAVTSAWAVYHERRLIDHYIYIVGLAVFILNGGAAWGGNKRWRRLGREFESYPKPIRIGGGIIVVALIVLTVVAASHFGAAYSHLPR